MPTNWDAATLRAVLERLQHAAWKLRSDFCWCDTGDGNPHTAACLEMQRVHAEAIAALAEAAAPRPVEIEHKPNCQRLLGLAAMAAPARHICPTCTCYGGGVTEERLLAYHGEVIKRDEEIARLKETNQRLNRRAQEAEAAAMRTAEEWGRGHPQGLETIYRLAKDGTADKVWQQAIACVERMKADAAKPEGSATEDVLDEVLAALRAHQGQEIEP